MKYILILSLLFLSCSVVFAKDKVIKEDIAPDEEEKKILEDVSAKETTYPNLKNIKKELKGIPGFKKKFFPVPIAYADPNVGLTFGAGLAGLFYDEHEKIRHLFVPYVHYNDLTKSGFTGRYLFFPTEKERFYYKISKSEKVDDEILMEYVNQKFYLDNLSVAFLLDAWDEGTARFYGLGYNTKEEAETNYTHREHLLESTFSYNFISHFDLSLKLDYRYFEVQRGVIEDIDQTVDVFKDSSFVDKDLLLSAKVKLAYQDSYTIFGRVLDTTISAWASKGALLFGSSKEVETFGGEVKLKFNVLDNLDFVGKASYEETHGPDLPFYVLHDLGGSRSLRGFHKGRFYGHHMLSGMTELRWHAFELNRFGFNTKWEFASFLDYGMVAEDRKDFSLFRFQAAGGFGVRTHFSKGVLTRIDVGFSEEGVKVYVDFGYPF